MRLLLILIVLATIFFSMTGIVYFEGCFDGALVVKPYPIFGAVFGGGEAGIWARRHPGQPLPWFMQDDLKIIFTFTWEYGYPRWVSVYELGFLTHLLALVVLPFIGAVKLVQLRARANSIPLSIRGNHYEESEN